MKVDSNTGRKGSKKAVKAYKLRYICHRCRKEFELPLAETVGSGRAVKCPECGGTDLQVINAPSCTIAIPGESQILMWDYVCHRCRSLFKLPVPRGPKEEKAVKCPGCGSMDISRINVGHSEVCPPGG